MKIRAAVPALAALMLTPAVWAQGAVATTSAPQKIGVISIQAAIASTAEGKQASAELQSQFAPRQAELQNLQKQIEEDQTRLRTGQTTLSDEEKARLSHDYDVQTRNYQRKSQEAQEDLNDAQQEVLNRIGRKMISILEKYSKDNGYTMILDTSAQQTPVLFWANQIDLTQDIIRLYDQNYPVKAAAATAPARPAAAPKPPAPAPTPKP
jgi:outer membrane protein